MGKELNAWMSTSATMQEYAASAASPTHVLILACTGLLCRGSNVRRA